MIKNHVVESTGTCYGYIRVSTIHQDGGRDTQELSIRRKASELKLRIEDIITITVSATKSLQRRKIDQVFEIIKPGDTVIVSELSRLARSVGQMVTIVDKFIKCNVRLVSIKENMDINGKSDLSTKVMITLFGLFAEIERDMISERIKEGVARAKATGKKIGRKKGVLQTSKLDDKVDQISSLYEKGINTSNVAKYFEVSRGTLLHFLRTRNLDHLKSAS